MSGTGVFIFLSSGASQRYRDDVLRAIALPRGAYLQFRYSVDAYVATGVQRALAIDPMSLVGRKALLCSLDRRLAVGATVMGSIAGAEKLTGVPGQPHQPEVVPCRYAQIAEVEVVGDAVFIRFALEGFPNLGDSKAFNDALRTEGDAARGRVPSWVAKGAEFEVVGEFWLERGEIPKDCLESNNRAADIAAFQKVVDRLAVHAEYSKETAFFHLIGIRKRQKKKLCDVGYIVPKEGRFSASSNKWLALDIFHHEPKSVQPKGRVQVSATFDEVQFDGPSAVHIDSWYDLAEVRLRTPATAVERRGVVDLHLHREDGAGPVLMMELPVCVPTSKLRFLAIAVLVSLAMFVASALDTLTREGFSWEKGGVVLAFQLVASLVVGFVAAFGIKMPL